MKEEEIKIEDIVIKYIFKERKYDTKHLVIVFSGFGGQSEFTYDFYNVFTNIKANVLWIKDDFFGHCCYYLAHNNKFCIENSIMALIRLYMSKTSVSLDQVTIVGASKGGSAALYYGIKYGFSNIVATVPQILIGSYLVESQPFNAKHIMGEDGSVQEFNKLILNEVLNDRQINKNIYILTSKSDVQYEKHIEPFISQFYKYNNINFLFSDSILAREHNQITAHHTDIIVGLISMLSTGIAPHIGFKALIGDTPIKILEDPVVIIDVKKLFINSGRLFVEGVGIVRGQEAKSYNQVDYNLVLSNIDSS